MLPETIYGKVELEPYFEMDYGYARLEFKIGMETKYVLKNISAFLHSSLIVCPASLVYNWQKDEKT